MTKKEFNILKIGDNVRLNARCGGNKGVLCTVIDKSPYRGQIEVQTVDNVPIYIMHGVKTIWNVISYGSADLIREGV